MYQGRAPQDRGEGRSVVQRLSYDSLERVMRLSIVCPSLVSQALPSPNNKGKTLVGPLDPTGQVPSIKYLLLRRISMNGEGQRPLREGWRMTQLAQASGFYCTFVRQEKRKCPTRPHFKSRRENMPCI